MLKLPRIADLMTSANLACGISAIVFTSLGKPSYACGLVLLAAFFDVLDGLAARTFGGSNELGAQLDSLADMVSFGVAPAFMVFFQGKVSTTVDVSFSWVLLLVAILLTVGSAWRLAKFNIDIRQTAGFLGLPTPANALFWVSMVAIANNMGIPGAGVDLPGIIQRSFFENELLILSVAGLMTFLMLSELPLPGLKFKHWGWKGNQVRYILLIVGGCLFLVWQAMAIPLILFLYLTCPLWGRPFALK